MTKPFKIVVVGMAGVGKTSLLQRVAYDHFDRTTSTMPTLGVDFVAHSITLDDGRQVDLQLWDTAGQERFSMVSSSFWRAADAIVAVFDATQSHSLSMATQYLHRIYDDFGGSRLHNDEHPLRVLIGMKCDLVESSKTENEQRLLVSNSPTLECGPIHMDARCSAKTGDNVHETFERLASRLSLRRLDDELRRKEMESQSSLVRLLDTRIMCILQ